MIDTLHANKMPRFTCYYEPMLKLPNYMHMGPKKYDVDEVSDRKRKATDFYQAEITASSGRVVVVRRAPYWGPRGAR